MENNKPDHAAPPARSSFSTRAVALIGATAIGAGLLSFIVVPTIQGTKDGLDMFAALCRAIGLQPEAGAAVSGRTAGSTVAFDRETRAILAAGDAAKGAAYATDVCASCHLPNSLTSDPQTVPTITGQSAKAIFKQLQDMKTGIRVSEVMKPIAAELTAGQMADLAAYYSNLPRRNDNNPEIPSSTPRTAALVESGDSARALPACAACHETRAGGPLETPHLTGQYPAYFEAQLKAYAEGTRRNDLYGRMRYIASKLTPEEMRELAAYYNAPRYPRF